MTYDLVCRGGISMLCTSAIPSPLRVQGQYAPLGAQQPACCAARTNRCCDFLRKSPWVMGPYPLRGQATHFPSGLQCQTWLASLRLTSRFGKALKSKACLLRCAGQAESLEQVQKRGLLPLRRQASYFDASPVMVLDNHECHN